MRDNNRATIEDIRCWANETRFPWIRCSQCVFCAWSVPKYYRGNEGRLHELRTLRGGEFEYLHRSPVSRRRRRKGKSQIWDSVTRTQEWLRWRGLAAIVNGRPVLSSERAPHINKPATNCNNKNLVVSPRWVLDTKTDWPTNRRS
jgi:hypothetical protein